MVEKRREAKGKGEKKRCTHLNREFQKITRREKKVFLTDQCKEIQEKKNRMGQTKDLFMKLKDTKRIFHEKLDTIKHKWYEPNRSR